MVDKAKTALAAAGVHPEEKTAAALIGVEEEVGAAEAEEDAMEVDEDLQRLSAPLGQQDKIYRLSADQRFKTGNYVSAGIEDQIFVIVFEFFVLLCAYKTPKRDVKFQVLSPQVLVLSARSWFIFFF